MTIYFSRFSVCASRGEAFPILAFFVPLLVRVLPEIIMGQYIVGFDTVSYYVPVTVRLINSGVGFWEIIGYAPLFYLFLVGLVSAGVPLIVSLKVLPPLLLGFLALAVYLFAKKSLAWSSKKSLFVSLLATLYFVGLRISWDMLRSELALIFLFAFLTFLHESLKRGSWKGFGLLLLSMVLVVLSDQLVAVIMFAIFSEIALESLFRHKYFALRNYILCGVPAAFLFGLIVYADYMVLPSLSAADGLGWSSLFGLSSFSDVVLATVGFFLFCYLPLIPFVLVGFKGLKSLELKVWVFWCLIGVLLPLIVYGAPLGYRWILLLVFPMSFLTVEGFERVSVGFWKKVFCGVLLFLSFSFVFLPAEYAFPYFRIFPYYAPSSMLQNSVQLSDCSDVVRVLSWANASLRSDSVLLVHDAFCGWAFLYLNKVRVVRYGYANPEEVAWKMVGKGYDRLFLVWWVSGEGWHGVSSLPSCFVEVFHSGRIAVYEYKAA